MQNTFTNQTPLQVAVFRACTPKRAIDYHRAIAESPLRFTEIIEWQDDFEDLKTWNVAKNKNKQLALARQLRPAWTLFLDCDVILKKFRPDQLPCGYASCCWSPNFGPGNTYTSWWAIPRQIIDEVPDFDENFIGYYFEDIDWMKRLGQMCHPDPEFFYGEHVPHPNVTGKEEVFEINRRYYNQKHGENL